METDLKIVEINLRNKKTHPIILQIGKPFWKETSTPAGCGQGAAEAPARAAAHFFHDHRILGTWFLVWDKV